ncbi:hypothetical protein GHT06_009077 [Daphnia sinensis]|uniref:Uncharacterized protein n=1 Tax=Daphnia sinensis TaxID=1820382 RepID=A0AAD5Q2T4_9CRUS|nr:hypothetical protein GHT06_009077 [Daphnia sinensis]
MLFYYYRNFLYFGAVVVVVCRPRASRRMGAETAGLVVMETVLPIFFFLSRVGKPVRWFATVEVAAAVAHIKLYYMCVCVCVHIYIYYPFVAMRVTVFQKDV